MGRALAAQLNLPFADALEKIRETPPQSTLKRRERLMNLRGAFRARPDYRPAKTVLVVDDISTTGATLIEAARALKKAGARTVIGAVVAKA
ncbi:ComF family protein [Candidatus Gottesmanbacteria bacterium]|nr:ComF family protein [Candidatus Gottesmanbacteria bacterium]